MLRNFYLQKGIMLNSLFVYQQQAPEIANIMQREYNRFSGSQANISYNADCFSNYLLIVAFVI